MLAGILVLALVLTACAGPAAKPEAPDAQLQHPAVMLRIVQGNGDFAAHERALLAASYESALREALTARALSPRDIQQADHLDREAAALRARELGADHALLVDVRIDKVETYFCREGRRPFRAPATMLVQTAEVVRGSDGVSRQTVGGPPLTVLDLEPDCDNPRDSRRRSDSETIRDGVNQLLRRLLGS
jgi:hypothetical protein